jgi:hypothetical protein
MENPVLFPQIRVVPSIILVIVITPVPPLDPGLEAVVPVVFRPLQVPIAVGCMLRFSCSHQPCTNVIAGARGATTARSVGVAEPVMGVRQSGAKAADTRTS